MLACYCMSLRRSINSSSCVFFSLCTLGTRCLTAYMAEMTVNGSALDQRSGINVNGLLLTPHI